MCFCQVWRERRISFANTLLAPSQSCKECENGKWPRPRTSKIMDTILKIWTLPHSYNCRPVEHLSSQVYFLWRQTLVIFPDSHFSCANPLIRRQKRHSKLWSNLCVCRWKKNLHFFPLRHPNVEALTGIPKALWDGLPPFPENFFLKRSRATPKVSCKNQEGDKTRSFQTGLFMKRLIQSNSCCCLQGICLWGVGLLATLPTHWATYQYANVV